MIWCLLAALALAEPDDGESTGPTMATERPADAEQADTEQADTEEEATEEAAGDEVSDDAADDDDGEEGGEERPFDLSNLPPEERARQAEIRRLGEEVVRHAGAGRTEALLRTYAQLLALTTVDLDAELHLLAAEAAVAQGQIAQAVARLQRVTDDEHRPEADETLASLSERYGSVRISAPVGSELSCPPRFVPDEKAAVAAAAEAVASEGRFVGLLPAVACTVGTASVGIVAGGHAELVAQ